MTKDTLFVDILHWDCKKVNEEEMRTNKCSHHAVSRRVDGLRHCHYKNIIRFHMVCRSNVKFICFDCFAMECIELHHFTIVNLLHCHYWCHKNHKVVCHHISAQQKIRCLWVHCVSFTSFRMSKLTIGCQWKMIGFHERIVHTVQWKDFLPSP